MEKKSRFLTKEEKKIITNLFPNEYTQIIANIIGRNYSTVTNFAFKNGLKKSNEFRKMELIKQGERLKISGAKNRFKKGNIPPNKGKKMSPELYSKCAPTMFKKGIDPHNTKYDGYERINADGYVEIRLSKGKFINKHRYIWEQTHGPIPEGMSIIFKDNNKLNITIDNLEIVTREELMKRNTIHRFTPELIGTIRTLQKLKKQLNAKEQN